MTTAPTAFPLTPLQQGMLFHYLRSPWQGTDLEQIVVRWRHAPQDASSLAARLEAAFAAVVARHEVLRAACRWEGLPEPEMVAAAHVACRVQTGRIAADGEALEQWLAADRATALDLGTAPLFRLTLLARGEAPPVLVWTFHHLLLDGRSFAPVLAEVFAALANGGAPTAAPPAATFGDHARFVHARDRSGEEPFWRQQLAGVRPGTPLPLPRPAAGTVKARGQVQGTLPAASTTALQELARGAGASLNSVVQAAWALLWSRYTGDPDVVFGAVRACRRGTVAGADAVVGTFINTLPFRARVDEAKTLREWLVELRATQRAIAPFEQTSLAEIQRWTGIGGGEHLFDSVLVFDHATLDTQMQAHGGLAAACTFELREQTVFPLSLYAYAEPELVLQVAYDGSRYGDDAMAALLGHLRQLLLGFAAAPAAPLHEIPMLTAAEVALAVPAAPPRVPYDPSTTAIARVVEQARRTPEAIALRQGDTTVTYRDLDQNSEALAAVLRQQGVRRGVLVGVCSTRCPALVVAVLGIWKAGGAYVPLDPNYPAERLRFKLADAAIAGLVGDADALAALAAGDGPAAPWRLPLVPATGLAAAAMPAAAAASPAAEPALATDLAYVIYTSGSTGRPKGVMVEHRNVVNFFTAMDATVPLPPGSVWLAVTSLAFDISVLELFWTLTRGCEVVLQAAVGATAHAPGTVDGKRPLAFSLFYFASDQGEATGAKYDLLLAGARFADQHGFEAIWTPERHFHAFGGLYPNPAVTSAALATITTRLQLRGGSVVLPLHDPLRVAEEWALVDNLSQGRTGIAFASGWQSNDFVLQPQNYRDRKDVLARGIDTVRRLWRGEAIERPGPDGRPVGVRTLPRPVQPELPVWITTAGNVETWEQAGRLGANVLTHLLGQSLADVRAKIDAYRTVRRSAGHPGPGRVTLMLHTFVGDSDEEVYQTVRQPMLDYLRSSVGLARDFIGAFPTFKTQGAGEGSAVREDFAALRPEELDALLEHSFRRYHDQSGLFGTLETCERMVERVQALGVDEVACLVDFGVPTAQVIAQFQRLGELQRRVQQKLAPPARLGVPATIAQHRVTHLQCTPSMAAMLLQEEGGREALARLRCLLVGGEALPSPLARELRALVPAVHNMYGPTETTVWSSTCAVAGDEDVVPIGTPIANTEFVVLDGHQRLRPRGVPGELYIGGDGVARGYLDRAELTAQRFVPHPLRPGQRLYRTGDLVRQRRDGTWEFLGRADSQVKVRGHRIELGEIEARLAEHPAVHECAVVVRPHPGGGDQLVAYLARRAGAAADADVLRAHLRHHLPEFMVPAQVVELPALPKTPNQKIDRGALPAPTAPAAVPTASPAASPTNELEQQIAAIWCEVLALPAVAPDQNFFDLGGHSLLTVQLQGRLKRQLGRAVALTDLFRYPTVRTLATFLAQEAPAAELVEVAQARAQARLDAADRTQWLRERRARGRSRSGGEGDAGA